MDEHERRGVTKYIGYFVDAMEPLHVACPVGTAKGAKECPVTLDLLSIDNVNSVLSN